MKKYIRICDCCGNTFETDKDNQTVCLFCYHKMLHDFSFWYNYVFDKEFIKLRYGKEIK
jgi:hypothetical protein